jgi:SEC-C motif domain protein
MTESANLNICPCGGGVSGTNKQSNKKRAPSYADCCQPYHDGTPAPTAVALMRSRYTAFALGLDSYLQATWHPRTRPAPAIGAQLNWIGLTVVHQALTDDTHATVSFIARYRADGRVHRLVETSRFVREISDNGLMRWFYVDGISS